MKAIHLIWGTKVICCGFWYALLHTVLLYGWMYYRCADNKVVQMEKREDVLPARNPMSTSMQRGTRLF